MSPRQPPYDDDTAVALDLKGSSRERLVAEVLRLQDEVDELQRLARLKEQYLSFATHELSTPLTSIKSYIEALTEHYGDPGFTQGPVFLKVLSRETSRLIRTVERTLQISRLTSRKQTVRRAPVLLRELVEEVIDAMRPVLTERDVSLDVKIADDFPIVLADRDLLKQVFINLVHNAVKFSPNGKRIEVSASQRETQVEIEVKDEGFGIAEPELQRVFDPYFRSGDGRVEVERGTGLGLAIVKTIIEQHGGQVWVESEIEVGTSFHVSIPHAERPKDAGNGAEG